MQNLAQLLQTEIAHLKAIQAIGRVTRYDVAALEAAGYVQNDARRFETVATVKKGVAVATRGGKVFLTVHKGGNFYAKLVA